MRQCMPNEPWQRGRPGGQCKHGRPSSTLLRTSRARTPHLPHAGLRQTENLAASSGASSKASTRNFWQVANSVEVTKSTDLRELDRVLRGGREAHKGSEREKRRRGFVVVVGVGFVALLLLPVRGKSCGAVAGAGGKR